LGYYYQYTEINYDLIKKYYNVAYNNGEKFLMLLFLYYKNTEINYDEQKKFLSMGMKQNDNNFIITIYNTYINEFLYQIDDKKNMYNIKIEDVAEKKHVLYVKMIMIQIY
jgi:hypothetical protein